MRDTWSITLTFRRRPSCPACAQELHQAAAVIVNGWLWCSTCVNASFPEAEAVRASMRGSWVVRNCVAAHGVRGWAPSDPDLAGATVLEAHLIRDGD
jgi:hypothetical protein